MRDTLTWTSLFCFLGSFQSCIMIIRVFCFWRERILSDMRRTLCKCAAFSSLPASKFPFLYLLEIFVAVSYPHTLTILQMIIVCAFARSLFLVRRAKVIINVFFTPLVIFSACGFARKTHDCLCVTVHFMCDKREANALDHV